MKSYLFFLFLLLLFPATSFSETILDVPFTTQAPRNQWRTQPFRDACEESSIIMIDAFYTNAKLTKSIVQKQILDLVSYETKNFGFHKDTNSIMTKKLIDARAKFSAHIVENASIDEIISEIDAEQPVIFHAYAPRLKNPYFKQPMNPYHVFVIIGYDLDTQEFIVNDPGTNYGKQYRYNFETLVKANHDWVQKNNIGQGTPVMIFTKK